MQRRSDESGVHLTPMTDEMYHAFFREYQNDPDLNLPGQEPVRYAYSEAGVERYIQRQRAFNRVTLGIQYRGEIVGEIQIKDLEEHKRATIGITLKAPEYKDRGIGTAAERLAVRYAFCELDVSTVYADTGKANTRSQHVLEKVGFSLIREDADYKYYRMDRESCQTQCGIPCQTAGTEEDHA